MKSHKRLIHSAILNRDAHADVFEIGDSPSFIFLLFGGSGIDDEEYELRSKTVIPIFDVPLARIAKRVPNLVLVHVTSPYDIPILSINNDVASANRWRDHVSDELLSPWAHLPYFITGFSGGAKLALSGIHAAPRCIGGACLGADGISSSFTLPVHWTAKLRLYSGQNDRVSNHPSNLAVSKTLAVRGQADQVRLPSGSHNLQDYTQERCLDELIILASELARTATATPPPLRQ